MAQKVRLDSRRTHSTVAYHNTEPPTSEYTDIHSNLCNIYRLGQIGIFDLKSSPVLAPESAD